jgi:hypothetical protein
MRIGPKKAFDQMALDNEAPCSKLQGIQTKANNQG